ncbi:MAG: hypothetical protein ACETWK_11190 [Candidatus Aminicenantaceae bacterium]
MQRTDLQSTELKSLFSRLLGCKAVSIEEIGWGRNSRVYQLRCEGPLTYAAKLYFTPHLNGRNRQEAEYSSLNFLWENGIRCIPRPIAVDWDRGCAVYEYINGSKISSKEVTNSDINFAVEFLEKLKNIKDRSGSRELPKASEACFSVQAIVRNIEIRMNRLSELKSIEIQYTALKEFLEKDFEPSFHKISEWSKLNLEQEGMSFVSELPYEERTLSPSDFGFHNALRLNEGRIVFLDFEHFGWDDPAKMVSDFLLHPEMKLDRSLKKQFVVRILRSFGDSKDLAKRIEIEYPLFGLKWCMILLNEFVPEHLQRRGFASKGGLDRSNLQVEQLKKAKQMLHRVMNEYECFPFNV